MKSKYSFYFSLVLSMLCTYVFGQGTEHAKDTVAEEPDTVELTTNSGIDIFASDELLQMTLRFDIREFLKTKSKSEYHDATLTVKIGEKDSITQHIKIKARGEFRRAYCSFPPIMVKFNKSNHKSDRIIQDKGTLKLVTHCNLRTVYEGYVFKEYLIYKLFNLVTPYSFRTRLAKINYVDINKTDKAFTTYGFLIENEDKLAERNKSVVMDNKRLTQKNMINSDMARVAVFNYMIGNTDWSVPLLHNIKVVKPLEVLTDKAIPIAYDFDYSGFVNTVYSIPFEELPIKTVTERYYMGVCYEKERLYPIIEEFESLKDEFLGTINNCEYLSGFDKKWTASYINDFFKVYKDPKLLVNELSRTCNQF
jgi:hypothetical protein